MLHEQEKREWCPVEDNVTNQEIRYKATEKSNIELIVDPTEEQKKEGNIFPSYEEVLYYIRCNEPK